MKSGKCKLIFQGLKKMGQSIETSYSSIQKLIVKYLQRYIEIHLVF